MQLADPNDSIYGPLVRLLTPWIGSNVPRLLGTLWRLATQTFWANVHGGLYKVLEYEVQLELVDPQGEVAIYRKRQRVRFLQDNVFAILDQAWGDGDIFADYKCSPGVAVDQ